MVESRGPESPFLTPKRVLKYQIKWKIFSFKLSFHRYPICGTFSERKVF